MRKVLAAGLLLSAFTCLAADINGKWKASVEGQNGIMEIVYTFKVEEGKVTGSVAGSMGEFAISEGKLAGDELSFVVQTDNLRAVHKGAVAGDEIKLNVEVGDNSVPIVAKRVK